MSGDEGFVAVVCSLLSLVGWSLWYRRSVVIARLGSRPGHRAALMWAPPACLLLLFLLLRIFAASDVRDDPRYLFLYTVMGAAWLKVAISASGILGISTRDDVLERHNPAALWAVIGALVAITLSFTGANFGDGPGWWVVVFCAGLSTLSLAILWAGLERLTHVSEAVTIDRDQAAGIRLAGWLAGLGLILGRSVAGDWHSPAQTVQDFAVSAWPVLALWAAAVLTEKPLRATPAEPAPSRVARGCIPACVYMCAAVVYVILLGAWS